MKDLKTEDYIFIKEIKHLLRPDENIVFISKTEMNYTKFNTPGDIAKYVILGTQNRILIIAKSKNNEFSTSFSFSELQHILIIKGFFYDKVKIHRYIFKLKKSASKRLAKISKYVPIKLSIWKYPVFFISIALSIIFIYHGFTYFRYFFIPSQTTTEKQTQNTNNQMPSQNDQIDKVLSDIISGYEYSFKLIEKNFPLYYKNSSSEGEPYSRFEEWIANEIIINLDSQDSKLSSLKISLEKHIMVRLGISNLRSLIVNYLDDCKKSFKQKKTLKKLIEHEKNIQNKINELKEILK